MEELVKSRMQDDEIYVRYDIGNKSIFILPILTDDMFDSIYYTALRLFDTEYVTQEEGKELTDDEKVSNGLIDKFFKNNKRDMRGLEKFVNDLVINVCCKDASNLGLSNYEFAILCSSLSKNVVGYDKIIEYLNKEVGKNNVTSYKVDKIFTERVVPILNVVEYLIENEDARNIFLTKVVETVEGKQNTEEKTKEKKEEG